MNEKELAEKEARANAATPGPWVSGWYIPSCDIEGCIHVGVECHYGKYELLQDNNYISVKLDDNASPIDEKINPVEIVSAGYIEGNGVQEESDAEFIAHAREDIPALIAEVRRLRAVLAEYADRGNWTTLDEHGMNPSEWLIAQDGWALAEECLREDSEQ